MHPSALQSVHISGSQAPFGHPTRAAITHPAPPGRGSRHSEIGDHAAGEAKGSHGADRASSGRSVR